MDARLIQMRMSISSDHCRTTLSPFRSFGAIFDFMIPISRRDLFAGAAVSMTARAYSQIRGANERLRIGVIGCGGMATSHMRNLVKMREGDNIDITAVCDVYAEARQQAAELTGGKIHQGLSRHPRQQGHRLRPDRHARALALPDHHGCHRRRQAHLLREADDPYASSSRRRSWPG